MRRKWGKIVHNPKRVFTSDPMGQPKKSSRVRKKEKKKSKILKGPANPAAGGARADEGKKVGPGAPSKKNARGETPFPRGGGGKEGMGEEGVAAQGEKSSRASPKESPGRKEGAVLRAKEERGNTHRSGKGAYHPTEREGRREVTCS